MTYFFTSMLAMLLSWLPLSALLFAFPAFEPQESVLTDVVAQRWSIWRRLFTLFIGLSLLLALLAFSVEITSRLMAAEVLPAKGQLGDVAAGFLDKVDKGRILLLKSTAPAPAGAEEQKQDNSQPNNQDPAEKEKQDRGRFTPLSQMLPEALVQHWPVVILFMYIGDLFILVAVGQVPIKYNIVNLVIRWKLTSLTLVAFCFVIALLVFMLGFVKGMSNLTENTGIPGNVFVMSEGATDELFSNLGYGDIGGIERARTNLDPKDRPLPRTIGVQKYDTNGQTKFTASRETYYVINMLIPDTSPPRRRFVQLRTVEDPYVASAVHNMELQADSRWPSDTGTSDGRIECVLGAGIAATLGADLLKPSLVPGDQFELGNFTWLVVGIMRSEGTTFGSEIWAKKNDLITKAFGKESPTTLVMRVDVKGDRAAEKAASQALAYELNKRYTQQKLKAFSEPDYYAELNKANNQFLIVIILLAVVMAIGGVFAMMIAMFASIAQRRRDIGVLRLLGFKRWQVLLSFMLESLMLAIVGGSAGVFLGWLIGNGRAATSTLSSGGGGGIKNFAVRMDIDIQIIVIGLLLSFVMGRLGGLVPALTAVRAKLLDTLR